MTLRGWQLGLSLGVALLTALAFALPLGYAARQQAADRAQQRSERRAAVLVTVLAATRDVDAVRAAWRSSGEDRASTCVRLPGAGTVGRCRASGDAAGRAARDGRTVRARVGGEEVVLLPVRLPEGGTALVESVVRKDERTDGVRAAWAVLAAAVVSLTLVAVLGADRVARRLVRSSDDLVEAASAVGRGELGVRVRVAGPREVREVATAFNAMTDRVTELMRHEREFAADLSHRLRTPLTALGLEADRVEGPVAERLRVAVRALDQEVTRLIGLTRQGSAVAPAGPGRPRTRADLAGVVGARMAFWSALAEAQGRGCEVTVAPGPVEVAVSEEDVVAALDALLGNVFRHTPPGTRCGVYAGPSDGVPTLVVEDAGPGVPAGEAARTRGHSGGASSGLGLDIATRAARAAGGGLVIGPGRLGGARVCLRFGARRPPALPRTDGDVARGDASPLPDAEV
ncbi:sensor histidine kinase [Streptomyces chumphonensis]|uniref:sensor histidine kinase n=1 Tax=Streptomyces chumphonensis TaxID=1214925 RepID=UPI003D723551